MNYTGNSFEIINSVKNAVPSFEENEFLEYIKWALQNLYECLNKGKEVEAKCTDELVNRMLSNKDEYRLDSNIDYITVQYTRFVNCNKIDDRMNIKIYTSIYFYDNTKNNEGTFNTSERYWNDIWMVNVREVEADDLSKCKRCGADMKYNKETDSFECEFCRNTVKNRRNFSWEITDIEVTK